MKRIMLLCAISLLGACSALLKPPPAIPDEYLVRCTAPGPLVAGDHQAVEVWAIKTATGARTCAETHDKLIDAVKRRDAVYD